jgi:hypothetical protein
MNKTLKLNILLIASAIFLLFSCATNEVKTITLDRNSVNLLLGQTDSLISTLEITGDITKFPQTWTSSNQAVASINNGSIKALATGSTTITVKAGTQSATCQVTVTNQISPSTYSGALVYYGDAYGTITDLIALNESHNFIIYFGDNTVNMNDFFTGNGERLMLELNTPITATDSIPSGTYDMMTQLSKDRLIPFSLVPAYMDDSNAEWGCWYYKIVSGKEVSFSESNMGNVVVSSTNKVYTIKYNLVDYYGNTVSGTFHGALTYYDNSTSTAAPKFKINHLIMKSKSPKFLKR